MFPMARIGTAKVTKGAIQRHIAVIVPAAVSGLCHWEGRWATIGAFASIERAIAVDCLPSSIKAAGTSRKTLTSEQNENARLRAHKSGSEPNARNCGHACRQRERGERIRIKKVYDSPAGCIAAWRRARGGTHTHLHKVQMLACVWHIRWHQQGSGSRRGRRSGTLRRCLRSRC